MALGLRSLTLIALAAYLAAFLLQYRSAREAALEQEQITRGRHRAVADVEVADAPDGEVAGILAADQETLEVAGLIQPAPFVQQINTLSGLIGGRVALNIVAGSSTAEQRGYGDFLEHDDRYARAEEFLHVCKSFWGGERVDVHVSH